MILNQKELQQKQTGKITRGEESEDKYEAMKRNIRSALRKYHDFKSKGVTTKTKTKTYLDGLDEDLKTIIKDIIENPEKEKIYEEFLTHDVSKIPKFEDIDNKNDLMKGILENFTLPAFGVKPIVTIKTEKLITDLDDDIFGDGSTGMNESQKEKLLEILEEVNDPTRDGIFDEGLGINAGVLRTYDFVIDLDNDDFLLTIPPDYIDIKTRLDEMANYRKTMTSVADIPIYFVISNPYTPHLTTIILYKSNLYSFGYGHTGAPSGEKAQEFNQRMRTTDKRKLNIAIQHYEQAAIYTPDYLLFENFKIEPDRPDMPPPKVYDVMKRTRGNIVDMGILDSKYCSKLKDTLKKMTRAILYIRCNKEQVGKTKRMKSCGITHLSIEVDETYSQLSHNYCTDNYRNCTSFVTQLFPHINCNLLRFPFLVHPYFCYKTRGVEIDKDIMGALYDIYRSDNTSKMIEFMEIIAGDDSPSPRKASKEKASKEKASKEKAKSKAKASKGGKRNKTAKIKN